MQCHNNKALQTNCLTGLDKLIPEIDVSSEFFDEESNHRLFSGGDGGEKGSVANFRPKGFTPGLCVLLTKNILVVLVLKSY
jgi:hypothetical protein